jgi:DNA-binding Lrp family transcriptional regulator
MDKELDYLDKKILYELDIDSRASASRIARKVKLPKETINYRIKRLINDCWVDSLYTIFNASKFGYSYHKIFYIAKD